MNLDKFKYKTTFSSQLKCVVDSNTDKYLAKASLEKLKKFIPEIDLDKQFDFLPISSVGFHINRANLNGDTVDTKTALEIKDYFIKKYISLEHNRANGSFGLITNVTFTEFESDKELKEEEIKDKNFTFSAVIGGLIWKVLNPKLTEIIEESNDPDSPNYLIASISYELAFSDFNILKVKGSSKDIEDGEIITNKEEISKIESYLTSNGGSGKIDENTRIYRILAGEVIPLGVSIVQRPANNSPGIAINNNKNILEETVESNSNLDNLTEISQNQINTVIQNSNLTEKNKYKLMIIKSIKELTDENLKECKASSVIELFENGIKDADEKWQAEKDSKDKSISELEIKQKQAAAEIEEYKTKVDALNKNVEEFKRQSLAKEMLEKFNTRMSYFDSEYELDDEDRGIIKDDIKEMNDEVFAAYSKKMAVFLKNKNKKNKKEDGKKHMKEDEMDEKMAKASVENKTEDTTKVIDGAIDNATKTTASLPNTNSNINEDWQSKYKDAFKFENCVEVGRKSNK